MAGLSHKDITIATTVYDRRVYISEAIRSAPVQRCQERPQVIVVKDCVPDAGLRDPALCVIPSEYSSRSEETSH